MDSVIVLGLILVGFLNVFYITDADHCNAKTDEQLLKPKIDLNISLEEPDNCSISYMAILNPISNPAIDDGCKIRGFHLHDGSVGPSCIPEIGNLQKDELFSINIKSHREEAGKLLKVLIDCKTFEDFKNAALYYKTKVNPMLFSHVFSSAIINRDDTQTFSAPSLLQTQPDLVFSNKVIQEATQRVLKNETKALRKYEGITEKYRKFDDEHEKAKYTRNEQIFDETKNNKNLKYTTPLPEEMESDTMMTESVQGLEGPVEEPEEEAGEAPGRKRPEEITVQIPDSRLPNSDRPSEMSHEPSMSHGGYGPSISNGPLNLQRPPKPKGHAMFHTPPRPPKQKKKLPVINMPEGDELKTLKSDLTGNHRNQEHKVSYFREDISINSHHSHWHQMYPGFPDIIKIQDRKGELFYYMHNQMLRRYDGARIAEGLAYVKPLEIKKSGTIIEEGYYPHLTSPNGAHYSGRSKNMKLRDVRHRSGNQNLVADLIDSIDSVKKAIKNKYLVDSNNKRVNLDEKTGINLLGAVIESSSDSDKKHLDYGDIHNTGHLLISYAHDNNQEFNAPGGVMLTTETALRDPVFWRWHKMVDDLFSYHKDQLPPYKDKDLTWKNVKILDLVIKTDNSKRNSYKRDTCYTYNRNRIVKIGRGLDLQGKPIWISMSHLDYLSFKYEMKIKNLFKKDVLGHVRIFISPKYTQDKNLATDEELRQHAIEMDRFTVRLNPGTNEIVRKSVESAVTTLPNSEWEELVEERMPKCGCGWPNHLLVPKGNTTGIEYVTFVMISDWIKERVLSSSNIERTCGNSLTMCGLKDLKFPDKRAMGFPLDRPFHGKEHWFRRPNMIKRDITIKHIYKYEPEED